MIVVCESCKTKFRLDPNRLKGMRSKVRCSRCGHVFIVSPPPEENLEEVILPYEDGDFEEEFSTPPPAYTGPASLYTTPKKRRGAKIVVWLVILLLLGGGAIWVLKSKGLDFLYKGRSEEQEASQPSGKNQITILDSTQAYFLENANVGQIFVIEGEVENKSDKPVSFILLEGKIYGTDNRVAQSQRCFCGNLMTREELKTLPITEIQNRMMNREGNSLSNVHVLSGSRVPFMLVFHNLPDIDTLSDYSVEVISAKVD